ncbi:MAG: arsenate reductase ArsC [Acidobacteriia bacterium]|nr:arsenate reductase ArsC [Terriglobia bacterium]
MSDGIRGGRPRLRGDSTLKPPANPEKIKKRVLFVCIGNACRSQMAEAFARAYGSDTLSAYSAGLSPAGILPPLTRQVLSEKNIPAEGQFPKGLGAFAGQPFEVVVNMSGERLPSALAATRLIEWIVRDPIGESESVYRAVAAQIEGLVMRLIIELRGT